MLGGCYADHDVDGDRAGGVNDDGDGDTNDVGGIGCGGGDDDDVSVKWYGKLWKSLL